MSPSVRFRLGRPAPLLCRWDLDKTYLHSEFDTLRQLWRTAWERAEDKVAVPGVPELIKAMKAAAERHGRQIATYFVSASPPQIGGAIRDKLALDGVPYDGITFKNQLEHLKRGKFRNLREHVGFKLGELLRGRRLAPPGAHELLFGDDWESDPLTYSLYADVLAGVMPAASLDVVLRRIGVDPRVVPELTALATELRPGVVDRIFINLARRTPPRALRVFGSRLVPTFNYFQTALVLSGMGYLDPVDVVGVADALVTRHGYTDRRLGYSLDDLVRRQLVTPHAARRAAMALRRAKLLAPGRPSPAVVRLRDWAQDLRARRRPLAPRTALDYGSVFERFPNLARARAAEGKS
ncbi:MAG TPA: phosphatase domain-containing protein [Candidatus Limnocylindria bacterium]|nr:phosphatase domain-containing protein [Candidatus Limnocylindria bacterium]